MVLECLNTVAQLTASIEACERAERPELKKQLQNPEGLTAYRRRAAFLKGLLPYAVDANSQQENTP